MTSGRMASRDDSVRAGSGGNGSSGLLEETATLSVQIQQFLDSLAYDGIAPTSTVQKRRPFRRIFPLQSLNEN